MTKYKIIYNLFLCTSKSLRIVFICLMLPGANLIKLITPTPKIWRWRNWEKRLFQSYISVFCCRNYDKRHFFGINFGIIFTPKFVRRKLRQKITFLCHKCFYRIGSSMHPSQSDHIRWLPLYLLFLTHLKLVKRKFSI